ncbi:MAG TPA: hypothetical protein VN538_02040 [Clostridia bacterium]|nr:hypothetical protein [Clostridia bacterium]
MEARYILGVCAAIVAGVLFNVGTVVQKLAVMQSGAESGLMKRLLRSPNWIAGLLIQMLLGSPLNLLALGLIGPAIVPGLSSVGLIVLAFGAVRFAKERFRAPEIAGIALVMAAVALFGISGLSVDVRAAGAYETAFVARLACFSGVIALLCAGCSIVQKRRPQWAGILRTLDAGLLLSLSNLWLGVLTVLLLDWVQARFALRLLPYIVVVSAVVATSGMRAIAQTQRAFAVGEASKLIPIQYVPSQIAPVLAYVLVFQLRFESMFALLTTLSAVVCVLAGSALLAGRQLAQEPHEPVPREAQ